MNYTVTPAEKSTVKVQINFTPEEWADANQKAYLQNRKKYSVNGFRKGKAPKAVLEMYYGKGLFYEEALNILYDEHYSAILEKEKENFTAVGEPELALGDDFSDTNVSIIATVPVKPEVTIGQYKGIKITKYEYTVTDADVERDIENTRRRLAKDVEATDRPAEEGDTVNIDFVGKKDGVAFDGGTAEKYDLTLGSHSFIPGFEEGVVGMNIGDVKDIGVTFPEDYQEESLKGQPAVFTVTLHKITGKELPVLDEEFAKKLGSDSVEAYSAKVRERLEKNAENRSRNETEDSILTEIAKTATAEIPEVLIERQEEMDIQRMEQNIMYQGIRPEDYYQYIGTTREEYKKKFEEDAKKMVMHQLIIEKLLKDENITASEEEIAQKIAEQAASVGKEPAEYEKTLDSRQREYIENDIRITKLFDFLIANNEMVLFTEEPKAE